MDQKAHQEVQNKQLKEAQNKQDQPLQLNPQDTCESLWVAVEGSWEDEQDLDEDNHDLEDDHDLDDFHEDDHV